MDTNNNLDDDHEEEEKDLIGKLQVDATVQRYAGNGLDKEGSIYNSIRQGRDKPDDQA